MTGLRGLRPGVRVRWALAFGLCAFVPGCLTREATIPENLRLRSLEFVNREGNVVMRLEADATGNAEMEMLDRRGVQRFSAGVGPEGDVSFAIFGSDGLVRFSIAVFSDNNTPMVYLFDGEGEHRGCWGVNEEDVCRLIIKDKEGNIVWSTGAVPVPLKKEDPGEREGE